MNQLISVNELHANLNDEISPVLIDVRSPGEYSQGHLPDAINIPVAHLEGMLDNIPDDKPIVTYCNMRHPGQSSSERAAETLRQIGYNARALAGGFPAWEQAGHPVDYQEHMTRQDPANRRDGNWG